MFLPIKEIQSSKNNKRSKSSNINKVTNKGKNLKIGWGTLGSIVVLFSWLFCLEFYKLPSAGNMILSSLNFGPWSSGKAQRNFPVYISLFFIFISFILTRVFHKDFGSKLGRRTSLYSFIIILTTVIINEMNN